MAGVLTERPLTPAETREVLKRRWQRCRSCMRTGWRTARWTRRPAGGAAYPLDAGARAGARSTVIEAQERRRGRDHGRRRLARQRDAEREEAPPRRSDAEPEHRRELDRDDDEDDQAARERREPAPVLPAALAQCGDAERQHAGGREDRGEAEDDAAALHQQAEQLGDDGKAVPPAASAPPTRAARPAPATPDRMRPRRR